MTAYPDIFAQISAKMNQFSKKERAIATYILTRPEDIPYLPISELAANCQVSDTTIFRFCKQLGLRGYPQLRLQVMKHLSYSDDVASASSTSFSHEDSLSEISSRLLDISQSALSRVCRNLSMTALEQAVQILCDADYVQFVGFGNMFLSAMEARIRFMQTSCKFHCDSDYQLQKIVANQLSEKSALIIFSASGNTQDVLDVAQIAKSHGCQIVLISRYAKSELASLADCTIVCDVVHDTQEQSMLTYQMGLLYIIEILYTEYCLHMSRK